MRHSDIEQYLQYRTAPGRAGARAKRRTGKWPAMGVALVALLGAFWYFTNSGNPTERAILDALRPLTGANNTGSAAAPGARPNNSAPVRVAQAVRRDMQVIRRTPGTVIANTSVQITSRIQGIIDSANFKEGQFVKKGDLLFQVDPRPFQAALEQARAVLARDQAALKNANRDKELYDHLNQIGAVSKQQRDTQESNVEVLIATIAADQAAINLAALNLEYTQIRAPVDGKTGTILIQPGNMVLATGTAPLVTLAEIQPVKISFNLAQADLPLILARQNTNNLMATVDTQEPNSEPVSAPIDFSSNAVNDKSGTVELRATFDNKDFSFLPGQLVNVTVELDTLPNAVVVPRDAVSEGADGSFVFVVADGKARQQNVKVLFDDGKYAAIAGEVKPGDAVIVEGQLRVGPTGAVNVLNPANRDPVSAGVAQPVPEERLVGLRPPLPATPEPATPEPAPIVEKLATAAENAPSATPAVYASARKALFVQAGAFTTETRADKAAAVLESLGARVTTGNSSDGHTVYRVRIGPFLNRDQAKIAVAQAQALGHADPFIVSE